jgi:hypothetical protein
VRIMAWKSPQQIRGAHDRGGACPDAWPTLPDGIKAQVLALVRHATDPIG